MIIVIMMQIIKPLHWLCHTFDDDKDDVQDNDDDDDDDNNNHKTSSLVVSHFCSFVTAHCCSITWGGFDH